MKNLIYILFLALILSSCSVNLSDIGKDKIEYVKAGIFCDSKATDFTILNPVDISEVFDGGKSSVNVKYSYKRAKGVILKGAIRIDRLKEVGENSKTFYLIGFKRNTFPFSDCRELKTKPKYFK